MADDPSRVHAAIFEQEDVTSRVYMKECYDWNIDIERISWTDAKGAGYARAEAQKFYDGEEYYYQIDSHSRFKQGWDTNMIEMHKSIGKDKVILSQHPLPMIPEGSNYRVVIKASQVVELSILPISNMEQGSSLLDCKKKQDEVRQAA